jgi:hypothetical protein
MLQTFRKEVVGVVLNLLEVLVVIPEALQVLLWRAVLVSAVLVVEVDILVAVVETQLDLVPVVEDLDMFIHQ